MRLERLRSVSLGGDLSSLKELKELDLSFCGLNSLTLNGTMSKLKHLNLGWNDFKDDIMRSMVAFPSLRYLSLEEYNIGGRLFANVISEVPNMPYLQVLLLNQNYFSGTLPMEGKHFVVK
ncbi:hypothetical protein M8C21_005101 [Ambrosia artemisiifolia]|uniref:F-box/LRR-repeat protein 15/At3g58940/PEG3-like LRR domain-containing protein n=1 Tax=Ambrosia artemisiifolia TaxID=4212 RepID=A0AAD5D6T1_AMBAR|nr:hypothetical protein M8C21_005101 [Ambrosia artemisiifolia]